MYASIFRQVTASLAAKVAETNSLKKPVALPSVPLKVVTKGTPKIASISHSSRSANLEIDAFTNIAFLVTKVILMFLSRKSNC